MLNRVFTKLTLKYKIILNCSVLRINSRVNYCYYSREYWLKHFWGFLLQCNIDLYIWFFFRARNHAIWFYFLPNFSFILCTFMAPNQISHFYCLLGSFVLNLTFLSSPAEFSEPHSVVSSGFYELFDRTRSVYHSDNQREITLNKNCICSLTRIIELTRNARNVRCISNWNIKLVVSAKENPCSWQTTNLL